MLSDWRLREAYNAKLQAHLTDALDDYTGELASRLFPESSQVAQRTRQFPGCATLHAEHPALLILSRPVLRGVCQYAHSGLCQSTNLTRLSRLGT